MNLLMGLLSQVSNNLSGLQPLNHIFNTEWGSPAIETCRNMQDTTICLGGLTIFKTTFILDWLVISFQTLINYNIVYILISYPYTPSSIFNFFFFLNCTISSMYISDFSLIISHPFLDFQAQCPSCCTQATYILSSTSFDSNYTFETPESFQFISTLFFMSSWSRVYFICLYWAKMSVKLMFIYWKGSFPWFL